MTLINESLTILKATEWRNIASADKEIIVGLFSVLGGWYGFSKIYPGSKAQVQINGEWIDAIVVDEGIINRRASVILADDAQLQIHKISYSDIKP
jgi:hypothetical protein